MSLLPPEQSEHLREAAHDYVQAHELALEQVLMENRGRLEDVLRLLDDVIETTEQEMRAFEERHQGYTLWRDDDLRAIHAALADYCQAIPGHKKGDYYVWSD